MVIQTAAQKSRRSFKSSVTTMYMVPPDLYNKLIEKVDRPCEKISIESMNEQHSINPSSQGPDGVNNTNSSAGMMNTGTQNDFSNMTDNARDDSEISFHPQRSSTPIPNRMDDPSMLSAAQSSPTVPTNPSMQQHQQPTDLPAAASSEKKVNFTFPSLTIYVCPVCRATFQTKLSMERHKIKQHQTTFQTEADLYRKPSEQVELPSVPEDEAVHPPGNRLNPEEISLSSEESMGSDLESIEVQDENERGKSTIPKLQVYYCSACQRVLKTRKGLIRHKFNIHGQGNVDIDKETPKHRFHPWKTTMHDSYKPHRKRKSINKPGQSDQSPPSKPKQTHPIKQGKTQQLKRKSAEPLPNIPEKATVQPSGSKLNPDVISLSTEKSMGSDLESAEVQDDNEKGKSTIPNLQVHYCSTCQKVLKTRKGLIRHKFNIHGQGNVDIDKEAPKHRFQPWKTTIHASYKPHRKKKSINKPGKSDQSPSSKPKPAQTKARLLLSESHPIKRGKTQRPKRTSAAPLQFTDWLAAPLDGGGKHKKLKKKSTTSLSAIGKKPKDLDDTHFSVM